MLSVEIAIHAGLAPAHLHEIPYIGAGFVAASLLLAATIAGLALSPRSTAPWRCGALLCVAMAAVFVASRTTGLPGFREAWTSDGYLGLLSIPPEATFVVLALSSTRPSRLWPVHARR
jgi:hypothetical protein